MAKNSSPPEPLPCKQCGEIFIKIRVNHKFCSNPCRMKHKVENRKPCSAKKAKKKFEMKHRYGLTLEQHADILDQLDKKCAICRKETRLHVDHCHTTGKVRGMLCPSCNFIIGAIERARPGHFRYLGGENEYQHLIPPNTVGTGFGKSKWTYGNGRARG